MITITGALEPVRAELIRRAERDAERISAGADEAAVRVLADARRRAEEILDEARAHGAADAHAVLAAGRARTRRTARVSQLRAQRAAYDELTRRVALALREVRTSTDYPATRESLATRARTVLGPQARVTEPAGGGVVGHLAGRRVDYSLETLARQAIEALGVELEELWTP